MALLGRPYSISEGYSTVEHHESVIVKQDIELQETPAYVPDGVRGFSFGYDQWVISIINVMDRFHAVFPRTDTAFGKGLMTGVLLLRSFIGGLFMPYLADRISRKWALTVVVVIFDVSAVIQTCAQNYSTLMGAPLYISKTSPPNLRGTLLVLESIPIVPGVVIWYWITFGTRLLNSEVLASISSPTRLGGLPLSIASKIAWSVFPSSEHCQTPMRRVPAEFQGIFTEVKFQGLIQEKKHPGKHGIKLELLSWLDLFGKKDWRRTVVGCGMSLTLSGVFNVLQLVTVVVCFLIIDKVGRRPLAIFGGFATAGAYIISVAILSGLYAKDWSAHTAVGWACVAMAFLFILIFGLTYSPLAWALPSEVFPIATRSMGVALSTSTNWLSNFIVGIATPPLMDNMCYRTYISTQSETSGKTLEEIDDDFGDSSGREEQEILRTAALSTARTSVQNTV
ncbi:major facilitator superfamily domain-containing protein [Aspergillus leporis]|uniref:Major facilitator superfamily domain-containing protein n=1 Tax=Aspergillus leporis TaxID=41062 RepID=A0A5N5X3W0_9EURO|nr:major facilitator superfamily domain-containing protein [Aspergillus leporis]